MSRNDIFKDRSGRWHFILNGEESPGYVREDIAKARKLEAIARETELEAERKREKEQKAAARKEAAAVRKAQKGTPVKDRKVPEADPEDVGEATRR